MHIYKTIHDHQALVLTGEIHHTFLFWQKYLAPKIEVLNMLHNNFSFFCISYVKVESVLLFPMCRPSLFMFY